MGDQPILDLRRSLRCEHCGTTHVSRQGVVPMLRLDTSPYLFKCYSCKKVTRLTHDTFIKLPLHEPSERPRRHLTSSSPVVLGSNPIKD